MIYRICKAKTLGNFQLFFKPLITKDLQANIFYENPIILFGRFPQTHVCDFCYTKRTAQPYCNRPIEKEVSLFFLTPQCLTNILIHYLFDSCSRDFLFIHICNLTQRQLPPLLFSLPLFLQGQSFP